MIRLQRLRLVNWHNFTDDLLDFRQITYFVGVNAVGKTTILDAIRYCLTASKDFNALGNKKSGRTLQGSVHGKQRGDEAGGYTRPGHTASYIGTEFEDSQAGSTFVIVVRVESESPEQEMRHVQQTWFITPPGCTLEMLPFVDPKTRQPTRREQFRLPGEKMPPMDKQSAALDRICKVLGIGRWDSPLGRKFKAVFPMGTSMDEIPDFRTFIYNYVLPQPEINLEDLQQDKVELERLQDVLNEARQRAERLGEITGAGRTAKARQTDVLVNEGFILYAACREAAGREEEILDRLARYNGQVDSLRERYDALKIREEEAHRRYMDACRTAEENQERRMLEELRRQEGERKREYGEAEKQLKELLNAEAQVEAFLGKAAPFRLEVRPETRPAAIEKAPAHSQQGLLEELDRAVRGMEPAVEEQYLSAHQARKTGRERGAELKNLIRTLDEGRWLYPDGDRANRVKEAVNKELETRGMEPDAKVLCEHLYMTDAGWQDCVEACLGNRRFDILVAPGHYRAAKHAFESLGEAVGRISLLDSPALERDAPSRGDPGADTLAAKVSSENPLAMGYTASLLGGIVCCEASDTLERHRNSATRDLLRHYPYRLERMARPRRFIGLDARKEQLEAARRELAALDRELAGLEKTCKTLEELRGAYQTVVRGTALRSITELWGSRKRQEECWLACQRLHKRIEEAEKNPLLLAVLQKEDLFRKEWQKLVKQCEDTAGDIRVCETKAREAQEEQARAIEDAERAAEGWEEFRAKNLVFVEEIGKKYQEAAQRRSPAEIVKNQSGRHNQFLKARDEYVNNTLVPLQRQFNERYVCDLPLGLAGLEQFQRQYDSLVNIDLERFSASLHNAQERCKERFRKDILYHMKDDIAGAKRQFKDLNRVMAKLNYGEEVYRFEMDGSADPHYNAFYNLIVDKNNRQLATEGSLENQLLTQDAAYEAQVDELMERIMADIDAASRARREGKRVSGTEFSSYVDYRTYLDYDIRVTNRVTGQQASLSRVSRDSSGGENQAPFYIAICASLLQIYQQSENSIRLVLLDEAFSKMTSDRIRPMMRMFRQMDLQVLLITTVEKSSAIHPDCDVTYSIVKSGTRNAVAPFYLEEK